MKGSSLRTKLIQVCCVGLTNVSIYRNIVQGWKKIVFCNVRIQNCLRSISLLIGILRVSDQAFVLEAGGSMIHLHVGQQILRNKTLYNLQLQVNLQSYTIDTCFVLWCNIQLMQKKSYDPQNNKLKDLPPITKDQEIKVIPNSNISVSHYYTEGQPEVKIYSIKFDSQDKYLAAGCENGTIKVFNVKKKTLAYTIGNQSKTPISYILWRPENKNFKTRNILTTANAEGEIQNWNLTSGKLLSTLKDDSPVTDKQLYCLDYNNDGTKLLAAGSEPVVRIYDEVKRKKELELKESNAPHNCHTNRVYCAKFNSDPQYQHLVYSGGWDQTLIAWDTRDGKPIQSIFGPYICGDGIANCGMDLLTASWRQNDQLQQWESRKCELNQTLDWDGIKVGSTPCLLYTCQFSKKNQDLIIAGGSSSNEVKLFDKSNNNKPFCAIYNLPREITTVDFSHDDSMFAISGADGYVRMFALNEVQ